MDTYSSITLDNLLKIEQENELFLPNFQREFVWSEKDQKSLLASFLVNIPIGSILLVNGNGDEYATRKLCLEKPFGAPKNKCKYLLDGQQRISTLKNIFYDHHSSLKNWKELLGDGQIYRSLKNRWFIFLDPENELSDLFGFHLLKFEQERIFQCRPLKYPLT